MEITPEIQELIDEKVKEATSSIDDLKTSYEQEKEKIVENSRKLLQEKKNLEQRLSQFEDVDLDEIKKLKQTLKTKEEQELLKEGKLDELVERRAMAIKMDLESKLSEKEEAYSEIDNRYKSLADRFDQYRIREAVMSEARAAKALDSAIEDIVLRSSGLFSLDKDGNILALDAEGNVKDLDGKPYTPKAFINKLKKDAPHLWPQSESANLRGSGEDGTPYGRGSAADEAARSGDMASYRKARQRQKRA